jgi:hypothetical protein
LFGAALTALREAKAAKQNEGGSSRASQERDQSQKVTLG